MNTTHAARLARLPSFAPPPLPPIFGFPHEPWKLCGIRRFEWFQNPERAVIPLHILFAQTLNHAADKDDLPFGVLNHIDAGAGRIIVYPIKADDPMILYRCSGQGDIRKNRTWASFLAWLDAVDRIPARQQLERHEAEVRAVIDAHNVRNAVAFRSLPYGHMLGPTPTPKGGFGLVGGGNAPGAGFRRGRKAVAAPLDYSDSLRGFHTLDGKPYNIEYEYNAEIDRQNRFFETGARNWRRIKAKGKKTPVGRPRLGGDKERRARELLASGLGIKKVAEKLGTGVSFVQRIKKGTETCPP